jgi:hypothetical protein
MGAAQADPGLRLRCGRYQSKFFKHRQKRHRTQQRAGGVEGTAISQEPAIFKHNRESAALPSSVNAQALN